MRKSAIKIIAIITVLATLCAILCACAPSPKPQDNAWVRIDDKSTTVLTIGESTTLTASREDSMYGFFAWGSSNSSILRVEYDHETCTILAVGVGSATITVSCQGKSDSITINVQDVTIDEDAQITLSCDDEDNVIYVGASTALTYVVYPEKYFYNVEIAVLRGREICDLVYDDTNGYRLRALDCGTVELVARFDRFASNILAIEILDRNPDEDPYEGVAEVDFYVNYTPATSELDAYYRTLHGLMSGSIDDQDQAPTISNYRPQEDGMYLRNTSAIYGDNGKSYSILDAYGNVVNTIYKGAGYVTLEEVAAYVYAFSDVPANYSDAKNAKPQNSVWGKYLRLNHSVFSGDTARYPYEPELPRISGCGGDLIYYEIDIGTTGTDSGSGYVVKEYNNGTTITRGAARIVYARFERFSGTLIDDMTQRHVFYTYNHYNDFQEYLNYEGGWGEKFGNETGGGKLSSKTDYNPTPYVPTKTKDFSQRERQYRLPHIVVFEIKRKIVFEQKMAA